MSGRPDCEWLALEAAVERNAEEPTDCGKFNGSMARWRSTPSRCACKLAACVELATPHIQLKLKDIFVYSQGVTGSLANRRVFGAYIAALFRCGVRMAAAAGPERSNR
jgi:hypothetical protein